MRSLRKQETATVSERQVSNSMSSAGLIPPNNTPARSSNDNYLREADAFEHTAFAFPEWKKWLILSVIFIVQISMNFNAAIYANSVAGMSEDFAIDKQQARIGQFVFLLFYAFGCEAWAPFSEEFGRFWIMQISLGLVNIWQIPCALAPNFTTVVVARGLGGLSSAGGSVTLGIVADMFKPADQQFALAYIVLSSVGGSVVAPIAGGFIETYLPWQWCFWISLIFGAVTQLLHFFIVPETRTDTMLDKRAKYLREKGIQQIWGPVEVRGPLRRRLSWKHIATLMWRPYKMLCTEWIVGFLSLLSGFSDAFIFTGLTSFGMVLDKWGFTTITKGLSFFALLVAYIIAWATHLPTYYADRRAMNGHPNAIRPERRMRRLLWSVWLLPLGLICYGALSIGPDYGVHWIGIAIFTAFVGFVNFDIYMDTIDYMVAAYGPYAASATGGNGFCRDALAGFAALYSEPLYQAFGGGNEKLGYFWPTLIPTIIAVFLCIPVAVFYTKGEWFRNRSPFAQKIAEAQAEQAIPEMAEMDAGADAEKRNRNTSQASDSVDRISNLNSESPERDVGATQGVVPKQEFEHVPP